MEDHEVKLEPNQSQMKRWFTKDHDSIINFKIGLN